MPHPCSVVRMLRQDLRLARARWIRAGVGREDRRERRESDALQYRDESGRVLDFHALRHTYISSLAAGGVHPKDAQTLARHSTITLTMDRYTHSARGAAARALDVLPDLSERRPEPERQRATGTYGSADEKRCTKSRLNTVQKGGKRSATVRISDTGCHLDETPENIGFHACSKALGRGGLEPPTHGFSVRCSTN